MFSSYWASLSTVSLTYKITHRSTTVIIHPVLWIWTLKGRLFKKLTQVYKAGWEATGFYWGFTFSTLLLSCLSGALVLCCVLSLWRPSPCFLPWADIFRSVPQYLELHICLYILKPMKHTSKQTGGKAFSYCMVYVAREKLPSWIPEARQLEMDLQLSSLKPVEDQYSWPEHYKTLPGFTFWIVWALKAFLPAVCFSVKVVYVLTI